MGNNNQISLVILTCNRKNTLSDLLNEIRHQTYQPSEVIIVDNNSNDGTYSMVGSKYPDIKIIKLSQNIGCAARNIGIRSALGDIIVTLDDDVFFKDHTAIAKVNKIFLRNSKINVLNFKILDYYTHQLLSFNWFHPYNMENYCDSEFVTDYISEGAVAFRRTVFDAAGYYPEDFFLSHEGPDLAYRILDSGFDIHYSPEIEVLHKCSSIQRDPWRNTYYDTRNQIWLAVRNLPFFSATFHICYRLFTTFLFGLRRRHLRWYFKAVFDGFNGIPHQKKFRRPISRSTQLRLKEIRRNKPGLLYQASSFTKRTRSINEKFAR